MEFDYYIMDYDTIFPFIVVVAEWRERMPDNVQLTINNYPANVPTPITGQIQSGDHLIGHNITLAPGTVHRSLQWLLHPICYYHHRHLHLQI